MRSKALFILSAIVATIGGLCFLVSRSRPNLTPTVHFIGTTPDGSQLLFDLDNSSSEPWLFIGFSPTVPIYRFQTPTSGRWIFPYEATPAPSGSKLADYPLTPHTKITFSVPLPQDGSQSINVAVVAYPVPFIGGDYVEKFRYEFRRLIGKQGATRPASALRESGMVTIVTR